ncbi:MAG: PHP domain-containing protein [Bacilli bacterium]|nr:PHP domain-containing protein [Bacilli bacterium]
MIRRRVDLHLHSVYSDGADTPAKIVELAKDKGLWTIALTDHDNIEGSKEIVKLNDDKINIYSGVELTAKVPKGRMHILGYNMDLENKKLNQTLKEMRDASIYNILLYIDILKRDFNVVLPQEEIDLMLQKKGNIGRPQLALLLIKLGYCKNVEETFQKYLIYAYDQVRSVKKGLTKEEAISLIIEAGGTASLAHPSSLKMEYEELKKEIAYLKSLGLSSIEVIHPNNDDREREMYKEIAKKYELLISGGTDYHGIDVKPDIKMGSGRAGNVTIDMNTLSLTKKIPNRYKKTN